MIRAFGARTAMSGHSLTPNSIKLSARVNKLDRSNHAG
jgi:hypothetical protein